jgi:hypothetical protein
MGKKIKIIAKFMGYKIENKKFQTLQYHSSNESDWVCDERKIVTLEGAEVCDYNNESDWVCDERKIVTLEGAEVCDYNNEPYFLLEDLPFNKNWDWLMPVVEKIESLGYTFKITGNIVTINHPFFEDIDYRKTDLSKIEAVYLGVLMFIKWYNNQKTLTKL